MDWIDVAVGVSRLLPAIVLTVAAVAIWRMMPRRSVWLYWLAIITASAIWRWVAAAILIYPVQFGWLYPWAQPLNQALYALLGFALIIVAVEHRNRGR